MSNAAGPQSGDKAPGFKAPRDGGETVSLADFSGKPVVLYFYPKDDTSGCTKEALAFTALAGDFKSAGAVVLGVSRDPVKKHDRFRDKHGLDVILISDEAGDITENYGVWVEKSMYGKKYMGIERATFLIDASGEVARVWRKVKVPGHAEDVLQAVGELG